MSSITYRPATLDDVSQIADIYNYYIRDTIITFEEVEIDADEIARRIQNVAALGLPNDLSVRLHERFGFKHVGTFTESGKKFDQWIDVGFWELDLSGKMTNERSAI